MATEPARLSRIPPGTHGFDPDFVARHQRRRILRATAEVVVERGYQRATIDRILASARVSSLTFYANFSGKEACFLAAFDEAVDRAGAQIEVAFASEGSWPRQLRAGLEAFFAAVTADPVLARMCLVESLNAGSTGYARHEAALRRFVPLLRPGRELSPRGDQMPETVETSLIGGIVWAVYQRLVTDHLDQIEDLIEDMLEFVLDFYLGHGSAQAARALEETGHD